LQLSHQSLLKAQQLAKNAEEKKEVRELLDVAASGLRELGAPPQAAAPEKAAGGDTNKDEEIEKLKRRLAELEAKPAAEPQAAPVAKPVKAPTVTQVGPPDIPATLPKLAPLKPTPKMAKGRVMNRNGKPLAGVEVTVSGTTLAGERSSFYPKTNAQGVFSTPVPDGIYTTRAEVKTIYNGQNYIFALHPLDGDHDLPQDSRKGVVEDYVWRLSGLRTAIAEDKAKPWNYYGAEVQGGISDMGSYSVINDTVAARERAEFPDGFRIDLTFTPAGPMPDGEPGRAFSFSKTYKPAEGFSPYGNCSFDIVDVPVGRYTVRARLTKADGSARDLMLTARRYRPLQTPALEQTLDFEPDVSSIRPADIQLYVWPIKEQ
jgi:hypothetical protein